MASALSHASLLVADPDPDAGALYGSVLNIREQYVTHAVDGRAALTKALASPFSFVITETVLPFIDGYSLCEILRSDSATQSVPILVITADVREESLERALFAGADCVLAKPFEPATVVTEAERLLGASRDLRDRSAQLLANAVFRRARADAALQRSLDARHRRRIHAHERVDTSSPPLAPPILQCPVCDRVLAYTFSHTGGLPSDFAEQWDYYSCPGTCGGFQYRQRTRTLRAV
jgi:CheY-like chemotaxis protein